MSYDVFMSLVKSYRDSMETGNWQAWAGLMADVLDDEDVDEIVEHLLLEAEAHATIGDSDHQPE